MEAPQIRAFTDKMPHRADDLNAMGVAVMQLVAKVNELQAQVDELADRLLAPTAKAAARPASK